MATEEVDKILSKIGQKVKFTYPGDEGTKRGILRDRAVFECPCEAGDIPYWDVVDLIEFDGEKETEFIRLGYYRRKPGQKLNWGSQTTITEPVSVIKGMLVSAAREKSWFRVILQDVMRDLENS